MSIEVWISKSPSPSRARLGDDWARLGELDMHETDARQLLQAYIGQKSMPRGRRFSFYADADPTSEGHQQLTGGDSTMRLNASDADAVGDFWVAFRRPDLAGRTRVTRRPARLGAGIKRPHEAHPGYRIRPTVVGIVLSPDELGFLEEV